MLLPRLNFHHRPFPLGANRLSMILVLRPPRAYSFCNTADCLCVSLVPLTLHASCAKRRARIVRSSCVAVFPRPCPLRHGFVAPRIRLAASPAQPLPAAEGNLFALRPTTGYVCGASARCPPATRADATTP